MVSSSALDVVCMSTLHVGCRKGGCFLAGTKKDTMIIICTQPIQRVIVNISHSFPFLSFFATFHRLASPLHDWLWIVYFATNLLFILESITYNLHTDLHKNYIYDLSLFYQNNNSLLLLFL